MLTYQKQIRLHNLFLLIYLIHQACPDMVETMKWSFPHFDYKGVFCSMASFKSHCAFNFWKAALLQYPKVILKNRAADGGEGMGHLGKITSLKDLPPDKKQSKKGKQDHLLHKLSIV